MVKTILNAAGFTENVTYRATRFIKPPAVSYCVYLDAFETRGSDDANLLKDHTTSIELYAYAPDDASEAAIEAAFDTQKMPYEKADRYFINDEQLFQTVYTFNYLEKIGG